MRSDSRTQEVDTIIALLSPLLLAGLWQMLVSVGALSDYAFSRPTDIAAAFAGLVSSGGFWEDIAMSVVRLTAGCALGVLLGIGLAFLLYLNGIARAALAPTLRFSGRRS